MTKPLLHDPRAIARNVPGIFDILFPQLTPGIVAHLNRTSEVFKTGPIDEGLVAECSLQHAMLFEISVAAGECLLRTGEIDWGQSFRLALERQRKYFDADLPAEMSNQDRAVSTLVARNMVEMIRALTFNSESGVDVSPYIPGCKWCDSGTGDFSSSSTLIEVKCTHRNFTAPDYRQLLIYWLLSYLSEIEGKGQEWSYGVLLNPRSAKYVTIDFTDLIGLIGGGRSKIEISELFLSLLELSDEH